MILTSEYINMKNLRRSIIATFNLIFVVSLMTGCKGGVTGDLVGVNYGSRWEDSRPSGMSFVKGGSFVMGPNADELHLDHKTSMRTVEVLPFWMDETEITNAEYKQFVHWVRDHIARSRLASPEIGAKDEFYLKSNKKGFDEDDEEMPRDLDWSRSIPWENKHNDEDIDLALSELYYKGGDILESATEINPTKLNYIYKWIDYNLASKRENRFDVNKGGFAKNLKEITPGMDSSEYMILRDTAYINEHGALINKSFYAPLRSRSSFVMTKITNIYPDTLCWLRDYSDSHNEPILTTYFSHASYADHPVVGVSWEQATAFAHWRTQLKKIAAKQNAEGFFKKKFDAYGGERFRLPSEAEWEYAARGGRSESLYPWGGSYVRNAKGCFLANFKPVRGRYSLDGFAITARVANYPANDFGLYDMAGNVAEWTSSAYSEVAYEMMHDFNPSYEYNARHSDPDIMKRKVIRGGSWKDIHYYLRCGTRTYEYQFETRAYIGFRCVRSYLGKVN